MHSYLQRVGAQGVLAGVRGHSGHQEDAAGYLAALALMNSGGVICLTAAAPPGFERNGCSTYRATFVGLGGIRMRRFLACSVHQHGYTGTGIASRGQSD